MYCSVIFYKNSDRGGSSTTYSYTQGKESGVMNSIDCLETSSNTWLVVYSDKYYGGDWMKVGPNIYQSDLKKISRGSDDNWKNQIQSFVMYDHEPAFWGTSSGTPTLDLPGCKAFFSENTDFEGDNVTYDGPVNVSPLPAYTTDYNKALDNSINSLKTGTQAWLAIYDAQNYTGNYCRIQPNTAYSDLNDLARGDGGDWKNQMQSFELFDTNPTSWHLSFNLDTFHEQFLDNFPDSTATGGSAIGYQTQDAQYRIYDPQVSFPDANSMVISLSIDHIIGLSTDDHATLTITVDGDGGIDNVNYTWDAGSTYQIPDSVVKAVDEGVEVAGAIGALETCGISEEAAQEFVEVFDTACQVFNDIANLMTKWMENDGGRFYMVPVVSHTINRAFNAVVDSAQSFSSLPAIDFNHTSFETNLGNQSGVSISKDWFQWSNTSGSLNQTMEYTKSDYTYRTWYQESSIMNGNIGMLLSCKIDFERTTGDDHIILLLGFSVTPPDNILVCQFAQASVQFHGSEDNNIVGVPVTSGDIAQGIYDSLSAILSIDFGTVDDTTAGRHTLPDIARLNVTAMLQSVE